jgi:hypothetical protein
MSLDLISYCFLKLALHREFHGQWRTGDQWVQILISKYKDCLTTILQQPDTFNSRMLDNALHKNKVIKANLGNYLTGTNATGIMSRSYRPQSTESSNESRIRVNCYCITAPFLPEPPLPTGVHFWYETIPTTTLRTSIRTMKRPRSGGTEISEEEQQQVGDTTNQPNQATMDIDVQHQLEPFVFDPFEDPRARKLFLPSEASEHPRSAIARRIDLLREVLSEPEGHKKIILGGDPYSNCTELDKIKLQEKAIYLINSLHICIKSVLIHPPRLFGLGFHDPALPTNQERKDFSSTPMNPLQIVNIGKNKQLATSNESDECFAGISLRLTKFNAMKVGNSYLKGDTILSQKMALTWWSFM